MAAGYVFSTNALDRAKEYDGKFPNNSDLQFLNFIELV